MEETDEVVKAVGVLDCILSFITSVSYGYVTLVYLTVISYVYRINVITFAGVRRRASQS